ncbi:hypothetical protein DES32_3150 [Methylovirgula ligni]|uniref:Acb2/Tad1 hairpin domain-containing protein n=1 Tax=Methylovirgula ligni TaxID=569860 RepID=A0A3D9YL25_9HYPH|nr:hypothetical protein [Methylovirgula ligni]REF83234.1 hypothetical protein DES32_3150 [Methylovirgula ligni]
MASVDSTSDERTVNNTMRHQYRVLSEAEKANMAAIKDKGLEFFELLTGLGNSRELSLAKTKIEEAVMWGVKHITAVLIVGFVLIAVGVSGAHAANAAAPASISLTPLLTYLGPIIGAVLVTLVGALLRLLFQILSAYLAKLHFSLTTDQYSTVIRSAQKIVGSWWAGIEPQIATAKFTASNTTVAALAEAVIDDLGPVATNLGLNQAAAQEFVLWVIGDLQKALLGGAATATSADPPKAVAK